MKILITGANGFIGSSLIAGLRPFYTKVIGLSRNKWSRPARRGDMIFLPSLLDSQAISQIISSDKPDVVIHAVGSPTVSFAENHSMDDYEATVLTTKSLIEGIQIAQLEPRLILISSAGVYGNNSGESLSELRVPIPISIYGKHKLMAEELINQAAQERNLKTSIIRPFSVYGSQLRKQVVFDLMKRFTNSNLGDTLIIEGSGDEVRDFTNIEDIILGMKIVIDAEFNGLINFGTGVSTSIKDLICHIRDYVNPKAKFTFSGTISALNPRSLIADTALARSLGYSPSVELKSELMKIAGDILQNRNKQ
jgi:nucleoside-diphosphate-sugar epimerase